MGLRAGLRFLLFPMNRRLFLFSAVGLALVGSPLVRAEDRPARPVKTVRLLTVGNSFSANATKYLGELTKAGGHVLVHHQASIGGGTMAQHWEKQEKHARDPQDPAGRYPTKKSLVEELQAERWDFITMQQASIRSHDAATYRPYARQLFDLIQQHAPDAEVVLHETWAYRRDDPRFAVATPKPGEPGTQQAMYEGLAQAYGTIAAELGVRIIPVGDAFHAADTDPEWGFRPDAKFDPKTAVKPALPDQDHSLHMGWSWKTEAGVASLKMDGHHASQAGCYLAGCVFYEFLFAESVVENSFVPKELDPAYAKFLRATAHAAVEKVKGAVPAVK